MKKLISLLICIMLLLPGASLFVQDATAAVAEDIPALATDENTLDLWAEDAVIDPSSDKATLYVNIAHNCGFWALYYYIVYPDCLTLSASNAASFLGANDLTVGRENTVRTKNLKSALTARGEDPDALMGGKYKSVALVYELNDTYGDCQKTDGRFTRLTFTYDESLNTQALDEFPVMVVPYPAGGGFCVHGEDSAAYAAGYDEYSVNYYDGVLTLSSDPTITVFDAVINEGDPTASFDVTVSNNPGIWCVQGYLVYDDVMTFDSMDAGTVFDSDDYIDPDYFPRIVDIDVEGAIADTGNYPRLAEYLAAAGVCAADKSMMIISAANSSLDNVTGNGLLLTVTLDTSSLEPGEYDIFYCSDTYSTINVDGESVLFSVTHGKLTVNGCSHAETSIVTVQATCTENGYSASVCDICGAELYRDPLPALGHSFEQKYTFDVQPTETSSGLKSKHCERCDAVTGGVTVDYLPGDVDGDGSVTSKDIRELKKYLAGLINDEDIAIYCADADCNGDVASKDVRAVKQMLVS
ncbi:MAG: dockerin type I repeat-containing protein [Clostridia bacterium]|nr:dockerin type I repeat-containing protein [Clostridia bacterium]